MKNQRQTISQNISIEKALKKLNLSGSKTLLVLGRNKKVLGTLSDGDLRRAILRNNGNLSEKISNIYNKNFYFIKNNDLTKKILTKAFVKNKFDIIPILDDHGNLIKLVSWEEIFNKTKKKSRKIQVPAVIMAGGMGSRLSEFTRVLPKPLLPLNDGTVVESIIQKFTEIGISNFHFTTHYKSKLLQAFFQELNPDYNVNFTIEKKPLGTSGGLSLLKQKIKGDFFVSNCDTLIDADFKQILAYHKDNKNLLTVICSSKNTKIPYGVCVIDENGDLERLQEKPSINNLIVTGVYILNSKIFDFIPHNKHQDMNTLIESVITKGLKIGVYPVSEESWSDVGQWAEYSETLRKLT